MAISDDVIYGGLLVLSIPFGLVIRRAENWQTRQYISTAIGALIVVAVCGVHTLHSLVTTFINTAIILLLGPKLCHIGSFIWCFGYLLFFRLTTWFGLPPVPAYANAVQLILTLKLVGLAFEIHDNSQSRKAIEKASSDEEKEALSAKYAAQNIQPSISDMFMYAYCYIGILTGPYFKYRTYHDMLHEKNTKNINLRQPLMQRLKWLPVCAAMFFLMGKFFTLKDVQSDAFYEQPFWFRLGYMIPMFFIFRLRFYCAWLLAECMFVTATLGAYPAATKPRIGAGPTDHAALQHSQSQSPESIEYSYETIRNITPYDVEAAGTVREALRHWNMTVQYWMASNVFKRLPRSLPRPLKSAVTMLVSAYWHGVHAGYHLSMLTTVPCMVAEDLLAAAFLHNRPPHHQRIFHWLVWFIRCRSFDYMSMGFMLLTLPATHRYWASVYYAGHVWTAALIAIGYCCAPPRPTKHTTKHDHRQAGDKQHEEAAATQKSEGDKKIQ